MTITVKEIDARLTKAKKIEDKDRKIAYIISLGQWLFMDMQMEQAEKGVALPDTTTPQNP